MNLQVKTLIDAQKKIKHFVAKALEVWCIRTEHSICECEVTDFTLTIKGIFLNVLESTYYEDTTFSVQFVSWEDIYKAT